MKSLQATIVIEYPSSRTAKAIANAVSPDNFSTPDALTVKTDQTKNQVSIEINTENKITTLISTIDDLLECISAAEKTLKVLKTKSEQRML